MGCSCGVYLPPEMKLGLTGRYVPQLEGVLVAHYQHEILDNTLKIIDECPYGVGFVEFDAILWSPQVGQKLCQSLDPVD